MKTFVSKWENDFLFRTQVKTEDFIYFFAGVLSFSGHYHVGRCFFVFHSQHPHGNVKFEQASLLFCFLLYGTGEGVVFSLFLSIVWHASPAPGLLERYFRKALSLFSTSALPPVVFNRPHA